ncbi:MAG: error-prone DNA polymerase [Candidatus Nealsonbacteria bacterium]|nr:error-prone DNA polymerase [Candidatus Nealsonbacteria bacterium]
MPYAELHAKTNFSFLEGASHPDELVRRAGELEYAAVAVMDLNSLAGVVRAHGAAKGLGVKLLVGAEITPVDAPPVVLLATDRAAYGRLARLITRGRRRAEKGECRISFDDVAEHARGLIAAVTPHSSLPTPHSPPSTIHHPPSTISRYRDVFGDRCYLLAELHYGPDDRRRLGQLTDLSRRLGVPLVAAGDVHYHVASRQALHDVLVAIRSGTTVAATGDHLFSNAQRHLKSPRAMAELFAEVPEAIRRTVEIADRCTFSLDELRYEYPEELAPQGQTPIEYLTRLTRSGAQNRYPRGMPEKVQRLIEHELDLIEELHYEAYFLTVWDLVRFARQRGILCQGRGSAANSAVCYCLGITSVDPERADLLFERFVSRERDEAPDIDVDFEHERREEVLQYLYEKYGRDRAGMTAEVITYRPRSAIRDVGKALGIPLDQLGRLAKQLEHFHEEPELDRRCRESGIDPLSAVGRQLIELVGQLVGFPRHLSQHTGGMVMTRGRLSELVPIENAAMADRTVIQWNKDDLDELGILKVDCLSLGMLTAIRKCFDLIEKHHGRKLTLADVPQRDRDVYEMICRADTMGVFQIESRAQMSMLPRLQPRCFYDLVIEVAIVRPGPIQGNMVHPYLRRRNGQEQVTYPNEAIRRVLGKTLGVPLFQEQAMRLAVVAAGFTPGEADQLRRAMGAWRRPGLIDQFRRKLIRGMRDKGFSPQYAEAVFTQIRGFGDYGFPESHAASFALLVYVSAWLKYHYPAAFACALLNSQPMGFYAPAQLVRDARGHGVEVLPVDVNYSEEDCTLEAPSSSTLPTPHSPLTTHPSLRLGLRMLRGMAAADMGRIVAARGEVPFRSMEDIAQRTGLGRAVLSRLAKAGVFASVELDRREALWHALDQDQKELPLFSRVRETHRPDSNKESVRCTHPTLPKMSPAEQVLADYRTTGLSLRAHPVKFLRAGLKEAGAVPAEQLKTWPDGKPVCVAGIVLVRQRPGTAKGITFVTLEDETGTANLIVRPNVWKRYRQAALGATLLLARGRLQRQGAIVHVLVAQLENLSDRMNEMASQSRDFI